MTLLPGRGPTTFALWLLLALLHVNDSENPSLLLVLRRDCGVAGFLGAALNHDDFCRVCYL